MKRFVFMCVALLMCVVSVFAETSANVETSGPDFFDRICQLHRTCYGSGAFRSRLYCFQVTRPYEQMGFNVGDGGCRRRCYLFQLVDEFRIPSGRCKYLGSSD